MTTFRRTLFGATATVLMAGGVASHALAESLTDALAKAYGANPTLQSARATLRATDEGVAQALSGWRPSLAATGTSSTNRTKSTTTNRDNWVDTKPRTMSLSLTQNLYAGGQTVADTSAAENEVKAQRARLHTTEQTVLLDAATAYLNVQRDQAVLDLNRRNEEVLSRHLDATRDRFNVGEITRTDVHQAESRLAGATAERIQAEGALKSSRATYANVIGEAPELLEAPNLDLALPGDLSGALAEAEDANPSIVAAAYDEKSARDSVDSTAAGLLPTVDLSASASRALSTTTVDKYWSNGLEGKVTLNVPLYQSGSVYSQLRQAKQSASASRLTLDQTRRDVTEGVTRAWEELSVVRARIGSIETQVRAAETALEGVAREASVGSRTVLDVLDAEQELLDARVNLVKAKRDEMVAALTLISSVGRLTASDLGLAVDAYDPNAHYREVRGKWFGGSAGDGVGQ
ncbi:MAG: TolC family outer membrane protein [Alphaproteobacteria bacterium]|nr:TolC family outer membrane protein [Alphaproteobacteria bacterium]MBF0250207.1 TolC family outer membrane protein [Alphaproteobacteria bacterium]